MKKLLVSVLVLLMLTACSAREINKEEPQIEKIEEEKVGGWTINFNLPEMNDAVFDIARQKIEGKSYSPLFILGSQPVAGENLQYLCYSKAVAPNAKTELKIVTVYKNIENIEESEIINVTDFNIEDYLQDKGNTTPEGLMGGWQDARELYNGLNDEENAIFNKALDGLTGVKYQPVVLLASQIVAGVNYAFLALGTSVTAEQATHLYVVNVYADTQGNATLNNICGIDLSSFAVKK